MPSKIGLTFIWFIHHHFDHHCHHRCRPPHHHLHHFDIFIPQCCGPARPFDMNITDNTGMEVVIINIDVTFVWSAINVTLHLSKCIFTFSWQRWFTWTICYLFLSFLEKGDSLEPTPSLSSLLLPMLPSRAWGRSIIVTIVFCYRHHHCYCHHRHHHCYHYQCHHLCPYHCCHCLTNSVVIVNFTILSLGKVLKTIVWHLPNIVFFLSSQHQVSSPPGSVIGTVEQQWSCLYPRSFTSSSSSSAPSSSSSSSALSPSSLSPTPSPSSSSSLSP